jgi:hypothetical protein
MNYWELVDYLKTNISLTNFKENHSRPQLCVMLQKLMPYNNWSASMCKTRQITHLKYWLILHSKL